MNSEELIKPLCELVAQAPSRLAPERSDELLEVVGPDKFECYFSHGSANFTAFPNENTIEITYAALMSLWATTHALLMIVGQAMGAARNGSNELSADPGSAAYEALQMIASAKRLIRDHTYEWPSSLPVPVPNPPDNSFDYYLNNAFLGASGWILLHEVAHIHLGHRSPTAIDLIDQDFSKKQERDADDWATGWVIQKSPEDLRRDFRVYCIASALVWISLVDQVRGPSITHPDAWVRFGDCAQKFGISSESVAFEMASYAIKIATVPYDDVPDVETPEDAFYFALITARRTAN